MSTIKAIAHLNELTRDVTNDCYLRPDILGTLYEDDIILRLEKKEIATKNVNGKAFVQLFLRECALAVSEGYNVVTGLFHATYSRRPVVAQYVDEAPVCASGRHYARRMAGESRYAVGFG
jgi:hypothetical protein